MSIREWWDYARKPGLLGRLSGGHGGRAALVLIGAYLIPPLVCFALWWAGQASVFEDARWIPVLLASVFAAVSIFWMMFAFGFWGVGINSGQDGGDQLEGDFPPRVAFGLGWLRWLVQVVTIGACGLVLFAIWTDLRWWHLLSTPEIRALPERAATVPIPGDWRLTDSRRSERLPGPPRGSYRQTFRVSDTFTYSDFETWFTSPAWETSFGARQAIRCSPRIERCTADVVPPEGEEATYSVEAWYFASTTYSSLSRSVRVNVHYRSPGAD